jgi:hypothetical protein
VPNTSLKARELLSHASFSPKEFIIKEICMPLAFVILI